ERQDDHQRPHREETAPEGDLETARMLQLARDHAGNRPHHGHADHQEDCFRVREFHGIQRCRCGLDPQSRQRRRLAQARAGRVSQEASRNARLRSYSFRWRLRSRMDFGVISTSSSSSMNSTAYSSVSWIGGVILIASSLPLTRKLVSCFMRTALTTRSLSQLWMPTIMPSYTGSPALTNMR